MHMHMRMRMHMHMRMRMHMHMHMHVHMQMHMVHGWYTHVHGLCMVHHACPRTHRSVGYAAAAVAGLSCALRLLFDAHGRFLPVAP